MQANLINCLTCHLMPNEDIDVVINFWQGGRRKLNSVNLDEQCLNIFLFFSLKKNLFFFVGDSTYHFASRHGILRPGTEDPRHHIAAPMKVEILQMLYSNTFTGLES